MSKKVWSTPVGGENEECNVCKTSYQICLTCEKYGRNDRHPLDGEKGRNALDNSGYVKDDGSSQTSWNKKENK